MGLRAPGGETLFAEQPLRADEPALSVGSTGLPGTLGVCWLLAEHSEARGGGGGLRMEQEAERAGAWPLCAGAGPGLWFLGVCVGGAGV